MCRGRGHTLRVRDIDLREAITGRLSIVAVDEDDKPTLSMSQREASQLRDVQRRRRKSTSNEADKHAHERPHFSARAFEIPARPPNIDTSFFLGLDCKKAQVYLHKFCKVVVESAMDDVRKSCGTCWAFGEARDIAADVDVTH